MDDDVYDFDIDFGETAKPKETVVASKSQPKKMMSGSALDKADSFLSKYAAKRTSSQPAMKSLGQKKSSYSLDVTAELVDSNSFDLSTDDFEEFMADESSEDSPIRSLKRQTNKFALHLTKSNLDKSEESESRLENIKSLSELLADSSPMQPSAYADLSMSSEMDDIQHSMSFNEETSVQDLAASDEKEAPPAPKKVAESLGNVKSFADLMNSSKTPAESLGKVQSMADFLAEADDIQHHESIESFNEETSVQDLIASDENEEPPAPKKVAESLGNVKSFADLMNSTKIPAESLGKVQSMADFLAESIESSNEIDESIESPSKQNVKPFSEDDDAEYSSDDYDSFEEESVAADSKSEPDEVISTSNYKEESLPAKVVVSTSNEDDSKVSPVAKVKPVVKVVTESPIKRKDSPVAVEPPAAPIVTSRSRVTIVRDFPSSKKPIMRDVGTQFCCNDASIQASIVPIGMQGTATHDIDRPSEVPTTKIPVAPAVPNEETLPVDPMALKITNPQLKIILHGIQLKRQQMHRVRESMGSYRYGTLSQTQEFLRKYKPPVRELWEIYMAEDPLLTKQEAMRKAQEEKVTCN